MGLEELLSEIMEKEDVRSLLSELRSRLQKKEVQTAECVDAKLVRRLQDLLMHEDAKTRKNAALLLGDLADEIYKLSDWVMVRDALWNSYRKEQTKFVWNAYIKALASYDCESLRDEMVSERKRLQQQDVAEEDKKHVRQLLEQLDALLADYEKKETYTFGGIKKKHPLILTTEPYMQEILLEQVKELGYTDARVVPRGVRVLADTLDTLQSLRIYREILFVIRFRSQTIAAEKNLAQAIVTSELLPLLEEVYGKKKQYPFVLRMGTEVESKKTKQIAYDIEKNSDNRLQNRPKDAIVELLSKQKKDGTSIVYARLSGCEANRFSYRKHVLPTSMSPIIAAQMVEWIEPYLQENAHVIDPFCGVGTLLIERMKKKRTRDVYGIDSYGEAIAYARDDAEAAKVSIYFINRDYFDFTSSYLMEELITEFPRMEHKEREEVDRFYQRFFDKTSEITAKDAMIFALSTEEQALKKQLRLHDEFQLVRQIPMRGREQIYILKKRG